MCENIAGIGDTGYSIKDANRTWKMGINIGAAGTGVFSIFNTTAGNHAITVNTTNQVGIGNIVATHQLQLSSDDAAKTATTTWATTSGAAVKKNIRDLEGGLEIINKLRPIEAEYNGNYNTPDGQRIVSLIAEEVREVLPGTVYSKKAKLKEDSEESDLLYFNPHEIIFQLILAVKQLSAELKELKASA